MRAGVTPDYVTAMAKFCTRSCQLLGASAGHILVRLYKSLSHIMVGLYESLVTF